MGSGASAATTTDKQNNNSDDKHLTPFKPTPSRRQAAKNHTHYNLTAPVIHSIGLRVAETDSMSSKGRSFFGRRKDPTADAASDGTPKPTIEGDSGRSLNDLMSGGHTVSKLWESDAITLEMSGKTSPPHWRFRNHTTGATMAMVLTEKREDVIFLRQIQVSKRVL
eukprot:m.28530 g.28530  ORF g.28530 m.28530 type:complete len:166 (+) comp9048_c0_seq1:93-590(+)